MAAEEQFAPDSAPPASTNEAEDPPAEGAQRDPVARAPGPPAAELLARASAEVAARSPDHVHDRALAELAGGRMPPVDQVVARARAVAAAHGGFAELSALADASGKPDTVTVADAVAGLRGLLAPAAADAPARPEPLAARHEQEPAPARSTAVEDARLRAEPAPSSTPDEATRGAALDANDEPAIANDVGADLDAELAADLDAELAADIDAELAADIDTELAADIDAELDTELAADIDTELAADIDTEFAADIDAELDMDIDAELDADLDMDIDAELDADLDMDIDAELDAALAGDIGQERGAGITSEAAHSLEAGAGPALDASSGATSEPAAALAAASGPSQALARGDAMDDSWLEGADDGFDEDLEGSIDHGKAASHLVGSAPVIDAGAELFADEPTVTAPDQPAAVRPDAHGAADEPLPPLPLDGGGVPQAIPESARGDRAMMVALPRDESTNIDPFDQEPSHGMEIEIEHGHDFAASDGTATHPGTSVDPSEMPTQVPPEPGARPADDLDGALEELELDAFDIEEIVEDVAPPPAPPPAPPRMQGQPPHAGRMPEGTPPHAPSTQLGHAPVAQAQQEYPPPPQPPATGAPQPGHAPSGPAQTQYPPAPAAPPPGMAPPAPTYPVAPPEIQNRQAEESDEGEKKRGFFGRIFKKS